MHELEHYNCLIIESKLVSLCLISTSRKRTFDSRAAIVYFRQHININSNSFKWSYIRWTLHAVESDRNTTPLFMTRKLVRDTIICIVWYSWHSKYKIYTAVFWNLIVLKHIYSNHACIIIILGLWWIWPENVSIDNVFHNVWMCKMNNLYSNHYEIK